MSRVNFFLDITGLGNFNIMNFTSKNFLGVLDVISLRKFWIIESPDIKWTCGIILPSTKIFHLILLCSTFRWTQASWLLMNVMFVNWIEMFSMKKIVPVNNTARLPSVIWIVWKMLSNLVRSATIERKIQRIRNQRHWDQILIFKFFI